MLALPLTMMHLSAVSSGGVSLEHEIIAHVPGKHQADCLRLVRGEGFSFAQAWQDWYLFHNHFSRKAWGDGFYVDVGANNPLWISNTLFFDRCLGWKGLCFEPQGTFAAGFRQNRSCELIPTCVSSSSLTVTLYGEGGGASIANANSAIAKRKDLQSKSFKCTILADELRRRKVSHVDFVSIDIEGSESAVLAGFPYNERHVDHWLVEVNKLDQRMIDLHFARNGYVNAQTLLNRRGRTGMPAAKVWLDCLYSRRAHSIVYPPRGFVCDASQRVYRGPHDCTSFDEDVMGTAVDIRNAKLSEDSEAWASWTLKGSAAPLCKPCSSCPSAPAPAPRSQPTCPRAPPSYQNVAALCLISATIGYIVGTRRQCEK